MFISPRPPSASLLGGGFQRMSPWHWFFAIFAALRESICLEGMGRIRGLSQLGRCHALLGPLLFNPGSWTQIPRQSIPTRPQAQLHPRRAECSAGRNRGNEIDPEEVPGLTRPYNDIDDNEIDERPATLTVKEQIHTWGRTSDREAAQCGPLNVCSCSE